MATISILHRVSGLGLTRTVGYTGSVGATTNVMKRPNYQLDEADANIIDSNNRIDMVMKPQNPYTPLPIDQYVPTPQYILATQPVRQPEPVIKTDPFIPGPAQLVTVDPNLYYTDSGQLPPPVNNSVGIATYVPATNQTQQNVQPQIPPIVNASQLSPASYIPSNLPLALQTTGLALYPQVAQSSNTGVPTTTGAGDSILSGSMTIFGYTAPTVTWVIVGGLGIYFLYSLFSGNGKRR